MNILLSFRTKILKNIATKRQKQVQMAIKKSAGKDNNEIKKSIEMKDAKISYLSLVDKPANKVEFLVAKNEDGKCPEFKISANIIKSTSNSTIHEIVGVVYEPFVGDAHNNFMTPEEIKKAANWFNENGLGADIQHNEKVVDGVNIVKSWVLEKDEEIEGTIYKSGTWLAKAQVTNQEIWEKIEKKEITGWSMGGTGTYVMEDVNIDEVKSQVEKSIFSKIAKALGFEEKINKGEFKDKYEDRSKRRNFWCAFEVLQDILYPWQTNELESDTEKIKEALTEFNEILTKILTGDDASIVKSLQIEKQLVIAKSGKSISSKNQKKLENILGEVNSILGIDEEEDEVMKAEDIKQITEAVVKAMGEQTASKTQTEEKHEEPTTISQEEMIAKAVQMAMAPVIKSLGIEEPKELTQEELIAQNVAKAVETAMAPIYKARGISKSLDPALVGGQQTEQPVTKSYMSQFKGE